MTLRRRIARLEARPGAQPEAEATMERDRLLALLARIEAAVVASGDASDRPDASPMERTVRRYLRGDAGMAEALRDLTEGRFA